MTKTLGIPRLHLLIAAVGFAVVVFGVLWVTYSDIRSFRDNHRRVLENEVISAALAIEQFVETRQRLVNVFAVEKRARLIELSKDPTDEDLLNELHASLRQWFPSYFTFTLTDRAGNDLVADIDGFVGEVCLRSIESFIEESDLGLAGSPHLYAPEIHPQAFNYHFDLMAKWRGEDGTVGGVFFVSFYPTIIQTRLGSYESQGHRLYLLNRNRENLIEVSSEGARDVFGDTRPITLTEPEQADILARRTVRNTRWEVVGLPEAELFPTFAQQRWTVASILILALAAATGGALFAVRTAEQARGRAQRETERANEALATEIAIKNRFFSIIGHDLKSPFTTLLGLSDVMVKMSDKLTKEQLVDYAGKINVSGKRVFELLDNLLEWARFQMEKGNIEQQEIPIDDAIAKNVEVFRDPAAAKRITLESSPSGLVVLADRNMVLLVIRNLVANAIKFTPQDGTITVEAREAQDMVEVAVRDTGTGITPDIVDKLFAVDQKTTTLGTDGEIGTGLGLPLCKEMIEANGGRIWVESVPGEGTTFRFTLPAASAPEL
ncbi:MAG: HAMP domain-containing sensor histidine kinase [Rhodospirillales bacterium]